MGIPMLKIRRPVGRLIFNMGIAIPSKTVFLIETAPWLFRVKQLHFPLIPYSPWQIYAPAMITQNQTKSIGKILVLFWHIMVYLQDSEHKCILDTKHCFKSQ